MANKTNVLLIIADQMRYDTINALGFNDVITPNLDKFVRRGCSFTHCFSSNPVCMPARHDLLLGLPSTSHGYLANQKKCIKDYGIPTLPRLFTENQYRTAAIGKMHFYPATMHHGYSELHLMEEIPRVREDDEYAMFLKKNGKGEIQNIHGVRPAIYHVPQRSQIESPLYETDWIESRTIKWLDDNNNNPFFLSVGYIKPHPPWDIPQKYEDLYKDVKIREPIKRSREFPENPDEDPWYGDCDSEEEKEKIRKAYLTTITMVDESIGKIIAHLEEKNLFDDTLIIFTSDHGEMLQDKGYYSKELPYDGAVRVPMIMCHKDTFKPGSINDDLVDLIDIFPTAIDVANIEYPSDVKTELYGSSLVDTKNGKNRDYVFSASGFLGESRFVMCQNHEYKYVYHYNGGVEEMYDLKNDPSEILNIASKMADDPIMKELRIQVFNYEKKWGPEGCIDGGKLIKFPAKKIGPYVHGKYHKWANMQFQRFTELEGEERRKEFLKEFDNALICQNKKGSFSRPDETYIELFEECLNKFTKNTL
jgi:arylsulfatase A-like enzyme